MNKLEHEMESHNFYTMCGGAYGGVRVPSLE